MFGFKRVLYSFNLLIGFRCRCVIKKENDSLFLSETKLRLGLTGRNQLEVDGGHSEAHLTQGSLSVLPAPACPTKSPREPESETSIKMNQMVRNPNIWGSKSDL